jgi:hypothetical protein
VGIPQVHGLAIELLPLALLLFLLTHQRHQCGLPCSGCCC